MAFDEVSFPLTVSYGGSGGPAWNTAIVETGSDREERVQRREVPRHSYDARALVQSREDLATVRSFYNARGGAARGFRWKDWLDYTSNANGITAPTNADVQIGVGDGTTTTFQLIKTSRVIEKPVSGSVLIAFDGVNQTSGFSVNTATGIVTFTPAPTTGVVITAGFEFDVPVRFERSIDQDFGATHEDFDVGNVPNIPLIELVDERPVRELQDFGGAVNHGTITSGMSITESQGRLHEVTPSTTGLYITMPDETALPTGGPYFVIVNSSASNSIELRDNGGGAFGTVAALQTSQVYLGVDGGGTRYWFSA